MNGDLRRMTPPERCVECSPIQVNQDALADAAGGQRLCARCGEAFVPYREFHRYCSARCRRAARRRLALAAPRHELSPEQAASLVREMRTALARATEAVQAP